MDGRRFLAFVLAASALAVATTFGVVTYLCGGIEQRLSSPPQPGDGTHCTSNFHPLVPVWAGFAVIGLVGLAFRRAWPAIVLGSIGLALGVVSGFSAGFFGMGAGALLLAAGIVGRGQTAVA